MPYNKYHFKFKSYKMDQSKYLALLHSIFLPQVNLFNLYVFNPYVK